MVCPCWEFKRLLCFSRYSKLYMLLEARNITSHMKEHKIEIFKYANCGREYVSCLPQNPFFHSNEMLSGITVRGWWKECLGGAHSDWKLSSLSSSFPPLRLDMMTRTPAASVACFTVWAPPRQAQHQEGKPALYCSSPEFSHISKN